MQDKLPQSSAVERIARLATGSTGAETILNIFKAVLSTAPFCGGLASLITDYIPTARAQRLASISTVLENN